MELQGFNTYRTLMLVSYHHHQFHQNLTVIIEKVFPNQATGEGIKRVPCYETPLTKHELDKWRKEFWETRTQGSQHIW